jgi:D-sedoheptulose 7-phosphate isomerase
MSLIQDCIKHLSVLEESQAYNNFKEVFNTYDKFIIIGNGGSNSIASHISQDYVKKCNKHSLTFSDPSMLTCFINDYGMENAYLAFLQAYIDTDTFVILISSGGESKNITNVIKHCEINSIPYGILTGFAKSNSARAYARNAKFDYYVASEDYGVVECVHQIFLHGVVE